jgi:hypothetical protein
MLCAARFVHHTKIPYFLLDFWINHADFPETLAPSAFQEKRR